MRWPVLLALAGLDSHLAIHPETSISRSLVASTLGDRKLLEMNRPMAPPMRCLLAKLPGGARVPTHIDRAPYFAQTIRLHIAVTSHELAFMYCAGQRYIMRPGELWALNNTAPHGVWNADPLRERTHLICDFLPTARLSDLLAAGDRDLGERDRDAEIRLAQASRQ